MLITAGRAARAIIKAVTAEKIDLIIRGFDVKIKKKGFGTSPGRY